MSGIAVLSTVALVAFLGSFVALCALRPAAVLLKLQDVAGELKHHQGEVPLIGGLAILAGYLSALAVHSDLIAANTYFLVASGILVISGTLDDRFVLTPISRLLIQIIVALIAVFGAGLTVDTIGASLLGGATEMGVFAVPFAILVIVGGINAWNMIDGIDGLASVLAFIGLSCMLVVSGSAAISIQASLLAVLCSIGAFFLFNLPLQGLRRRRTFLGDAGSMFLGLAVVWHALSLSQGETATMSPITALWFVALPVFDVITTTLRRVLNGNSPLAGDRQHLHHLLQDQGLSVRQTLKVLAILASICAAIGLISHSVGISDGQMFALFALFGAVYFVGVRRLAKAVLMAGAAPA